MENPDILATLGARKQHQVVWAAAETNDVVANAEKKLVSKHADLVVANEGGGQRVRRDDNAGGSGRRETSRLPPHIEDPPHRRILDKAIQRFIECGEYSEEGSED